MIGYLTGADLIGLLESGAVHCLYSTSTTYAHRGDITSVYFFDIAWREIAHQTGMDTKNTFTLYSRSWGDNFNGNRDGYLLSGRFNLLREAYKNKNISKHNTYRIIATKGE